MMFVSLVYPRVLWFLTLVGVGSQASGRPAFWAHDGGWGYASYPIPRCANELRTFTPPILRVLSSKMMFISLDYNRFLWFLTLVGLAQTGLLGPNVGWPVSPGDPLWVFDPQPAPGPFFDLGPKGLNPRVSRETGGAHGFYKKTDSYAPRS